MMKNGKEEIPCEYDRVSYFNEIDESDERNDYYDNYNDNGSQVSISSNYEIIDIKDNKIIIQTDNNYYDEDTKYEMNFIIIDMFGNTLLKTTALDVYDNIYLVKK